MEIDKENVVETNIVFMATVLELVLKLGVPAAIKAIQGFDVKEPTLADFKKLKDIVKKPEDYFK